MTKSQVWHRS